jgi:hypothetical protein
MRAIFSAIVTALLGLAWPAGTDTALAGDTSHPRLAPGAHVSDLSAQRRPPPRAPTRITVYPRSYSYPGPNAVRQCTSWLEPEFRLSGTVIVPRMRCRWEGG